MSSKWRKSSYSSAQGGDCVECAPFGDATWTKSSYSSAQGGECVECAEISRGIAVRDSKNPGGPRLHFTTTAWHDFLGYATAALHTNGAA